MASNNTSFGDAPPRYDAIQAGFPLNPGQPSGCPPVGYPSHQPGSYPLLQIIYPPPQAGLPSTGAQVGHLNTTVVTRPGSSAAPGFTYRYMRYPALVICQHCQVTVTTSVQYKYSSLALFLAIVFLMCFCCLGCCLIPFFIDITKDIVHRCPNCQKVVGKYIYKNYERVIKKRNDNIML